MDKFEEQILAGIGIFVKDANGNLRPIEFVIADFEARWPTLAKEQQVITAMVVLILYRRYF